MSLTNQVSEDDIPAGFVRHTRRSPLTDPWEPLYSCRTGKNLLLAIKVDAAHTNSRGFVHGGLIAALADNAMGLSCLMHSDSSGGGVTTNLSLDYLSTAKIGEWLVFDTHFVKSGKTLSFAEAHVRVGDKVIARANATFMQATNSAERSAGA